MSVTNKFGIYAVKIGANLVGGVTQSAVNLGNQVRSIPTSGEVYSRFISLVAGAPGAGFSTLAIASALDEVSVTGVDIGGLTGGFIIYGQKHASGATRASGAAHKSYTINDGIIAPRSLSCDFQGDAVISYEAIVVYDGTNEPVIPAESVTLPVIASDAERFTLGEVSVGGVALTHLRGIDIDFGINISPIGADSDIYPTFASIDTISPTVTLRGINLDWLKTTGAIDADGLIATHANTSIIFRKRADGATFVADITAEHVKITADGIAVINTAMSGGQGDDAEVDITIQTRYDGTNAPITVDTTATI